MADYNYIYSSDINNLVEGTDGNDRIDIWGANTTIMAYGGNDIVSLRSISSYYKGDTSRWVYCGDGRDLVYVYNKNVFVYGEADSDDFEIRHDYAYVEGNEGNDLFNVDINFYSKAPYDNITITGGAGNDSLEINPHRYYKGVYANILFTDFSNDDAICLQDDIDSYSDDGHVILTQTVENGEVVIRDNVSIQSGDAGTSTISTDPSFSVTLRGVSDINQVADAKFYRYINQGDDYITFRELFGVSSIIDTTVETSFLNKDGNAYTYSGGDKVINNYQQGEVVKLTSDYQGIDLNGNSFYVKSSSGSLEIQNARDKVIGYSAGNDDVAVYSYLAGGGGNIDGRGISQAEIIIGGDNSDNQIYAGSGGSSMWGGNGGNDNLIGGDGYDEFFYAMGSGNDVVQNAGSNDLINLLGISLSQISYAEVNYSEINIGFTDGGNLKLQGQAATGFMLEGVVYAADRITGQWSTK